MPHSFVLGGGGAVELACHRFFHHFYRHFFTPFPTSPLTFTGSSKYEVI